MRVITDEDAFPIIATIHARMADQSPLLRSMLEVQKRYDGNVVAIPLPDVEGSPSLPKLTPLYIANAIDDVALAAASTWPMIHVPATNPTKATGKWSREYARIHRQALQATGRANHMNLQMRRALRQLTGYATWSQVVMPSEYGPCLELREPLATYPDPKAPEDPSPPKDVAFLFQKSASWIRYEYPQTKRENGGPIPPPSSNFDAGAWTMFEWLDCEQVVVGLLGPTHMNIEQAQGYLGFSQVWKVLSVDENRLGYVPAVIPRRASMSRIAAQISQLVGLADIMDRLMALDLVAQEKAIFPDRYIVSSEGRNARIEGGRWKDGREGETNILMDVEEVGQMNSFVDPRTSQMHDRLANAFQRSAGVTPQMRGETFGNLRTGRAMDTMHQIAVDPRVQEVHEIAQAALGYFYRAVTDTYKAYYGSRQFSMVAGRQSEVARVEFTPNTHMEHSDVVVEYAIPGATAEQLTVALGMLTSAEMISKATARRLHPWVADPEAEELEVVAEQLDDAMLQGVIKGVLTSTEPGMSPALLYAAKLKEKIIEGQTIDMAMREAWAEVQKEQAALLPAQPDPTTMLPDPAMMPGLAGLPIPGGGMMAPTQGPPPGAAPPPGPAEGLPQLMAAMAAQPGAPV